MTTRRMLFTGATGTIGAPLLDALIAAYPDMPIRIANDVEPRSGPNVEWIPTDFRNSDIDYDALVEGCDLVFHLAAETMPHHRHFHEVNVIATQKLVEAAERSGTVGRFLYTSTCLVYGFPDSRFVPDGQPLRHPPYLPAGEPMLDYAISKYESEKVLEQGAQNLTYVILRPVHVISREAIDRLPEQISGRRRFWWWHRPWHSIATENAIRTLKAFVETDVWGRLEKPVSYFNFSADRKDVRYFEVLEQRTQSLLERPLLKILPWLDLVKDMVKMRYLRKSWNYSSTVYDGSGLKRLGVGIEQSFPRGDAH